jgi:hypothetical protein
VTWTTVAAVLWRELDTPGHDACRLETRDGAWRLDGAAVFRDERGRPARLAYQVEADAAWRTRRGRVQGWLGAQAVELDIARTADGGWTLNGAPAAGLEGMVDLDLGFTPATNLLPLRRLALADGQTADAPAAWLDPAAGTLVVLPQRYTRRSATVYWYESSGGGYAGVLEVEPTGFIRRYPGLWEIEA